MKSGASDPFADEGAGGDDGDASASDGNDDVTEDPSDAADARADPVETPDSDSSAGVDRDISRSELPLVLRRDRVKDERPEVHQLFVQEGTHEKAIEAERALESRFDEDLARTDAREAIYLAGMQSLDEAETILRQWGYDL